MEALRAADTDGSGELTPAEMVTVMRGMAEAHKTNKRLGKQIWVLLGLIFLLVGALVGTSVSGAILGGELIKDSKVPSCSDPTDRRCNPANLVSVNTVESFVTSIFDLPSVATNQVRATICGASAA